MICSGELLKNRYEVLGVIGRGGMSTVYKARDCQSGKLLAIKDVERRGTQDNQIVAQSLAVEGRMLKQLDNEHLPHIYDIIERDDSFVLVMDFIEGESLDKLTLRCGRQSEMNVLDWGIQICDVLEYLHSQTPPVIYRDMKPANVILCPDGQVKMIDFGTARTQKIGQELKSDTVCIGTEGFAAPEQYGGTGESDARTDIFCLGATLYNLVTGHSPSDPPKGILPLEYWDRELAASPLAPIIRRCTQNDPNNRYQSARELRDELTAAKEHLSSGSPLLTLLGLTGGRKNPWSRQKTKVGGETSMLNAQPRDEQTTEKIRPAEPVTEPEPPARPPVGETPDGGAEADGGVWRRVMLASAIASVCLLLAGAALLLLRHTLIGEALLILALAAAVLAAVGIFAMIWEKKKEQDVPR